MHREAGPAPSRREPFDWIFARAAGPRTGRHWQVARQGQEDSPRTPWPRVQTATTKSRGPATPHDGDLSEKLLELCGPSIGHSRILEVTDGEPLLAEALGRLAPREYTAVMTGDGDTRGWASRLPRFEFRSGAAEDCLAVGRPFDRIAATCRRINDKDYVALSTLADRLARRGLLILLSSPDNDWTTCQAAHHRLRLRLQDRIPLNSTTTLLVSARR